MDWSILSPAIIVTSSFAFVGLERLFPYNEGQRVFREGFFLDLVLYGLVQSWLLGKLISSFVAWVDGSTRMSRLHLVTDWPLWSQIVFFLVVHDLYIYWFHRAQHAFPLLWRIHEAHHSGKYVDWLSGTRSHALEILINQTIEFAPIVLLGAKPEVWLIKATLDAVWGMYIHSNLDVRLGMLEIVINGPDMHRWHHARADDVKGVNFATKLGVWDRLFGTAYIRSERAQEFGLLGDVEFPRGFIGQQLAAFRR